MYISKVEKAVVVAAMVHKDQVRKATTIPYITHPMCVMLTAARVTHDEDILCACLLHDVLEDGNPLVYGKTELLRDFGENCVSIITSVTKNENIPVWRERNLDYIARIKSSNNSAALIVCAADKIHNLKSILDDYEVVGEKLWSRFHAGKDEQRWWYHSILTLLEEKIAGNQLVDELRILINQLDSL